MVKNDIFSYFNTARMRQSDRMTIASCGDKNSVNTAARPPNGSNVLSNYIFFVRNTYATQYKARNHCDVFRRRVCLFVVRAECFVQYHSLKAGLLFGHVLLGVCSYCLNCAKVQHYSAQVVESASERLFRVCLFRFECAIFCIAYTLCGM